MAGKTYNARKIAGAGLFFGAAFAIAAHGVDWLAGEPLEKAAVKWEQDTYAAYHARGEKAPYLIEAFNRDPRNQGGSLDLGLFAIGALGGGLAWKRYVIGKKPGNASKDDPAPRP
jgi:hypothetical protein